MAGTATITVRRQILDVEVHGTESEGLALQRRLPGVCADVLWPALESAFAPGDPGDAHLVVERLAIDVSGISLDRLDAELADAVQREVADYLRRNPAVPFDAAGAPKSGDVQRRTVAETVDEALVVFLRTGRLPWSFRVPPGSRLEQLVVDAWGAANADRGPPPAMRARLSEILAVPGARARLVMQFTPGFVATVLRGVSPQLAATTMEVLDALDAGPSPSPARAVFTRRVWDAALVAAAAGRRPGPDELARTAWRAQSSPIVERDDRTLATALERRWPGVTEETQRTPWPRSRRSAAAADAAPAPPGGPPRRGTRGAPRRQRRGRAPAPLPAPLLRRARDRHGRRAGRPRPRAVPAPPPRHRRADRTGAPAHAGEGPVRRGARRAGRGRRRA